MEKGSKGYEGFCEEQQNNAGSSTVPSPSSAVQLAPTKRYAKYYNMNYSKRSLALIFNHEFFIKSLSLDIRHGTNVDCKSLKIALENLGFEVKDYHNLTHKDIEKQLERVAEMDHSEHDCLVVAVLSHGELGVLYAYDTNYEADSLWHYFTADRCQSLAGKPKLFFIQACQGGKLDPGINLKERIETDGKFVPMTFRIPTHADFLIAYSTIPGYSAIRNCDNGSWFIQALCVELRENGTHYNLLDLLTFVCQRVAVDFETKKPDKMSKHQKKQIPCITTTLTRLVKFQNTDEISCYANAVLQCIFHSNTIRQQLLNSDNLSSDVLSILAREYENGMHNLNTCAIRKYLGEYFLINTKQDAFDFLKALCTKYDFIKNLVEHEVKSTSLCKKCSYENVTIHNNVILSIPISNVKKKSIKLNDLLNSCWSEYEKACERCEANMLIKNELTRINQTVIIHLISFSLQNGVLEKVPQKCNLNAVPTSKILLSGQEYKVMNAIFHHGSSIRNGHFTSMCREGSSRKWFETDDTQVTKKRWPMGAKDIYILFLEKVGSKVGK